MIPRRDSAPCLPQFLETRARSDCARSSVARDKVAACVCDRHQCYLRGGATREARGVMSASGSAEVAAATFNYIRLTSEAMTARSAGLPLTSGPAFPSAPSPALSFGLWHHAAIGLERWEETMCGLFVLEYLFLIPFLLNFTLYISTKIAVLSTHWNIGKNMLVTRYYFLFNVTDLLFVTVVVLEVELFELV